MRALYVILPILCILAIAYRYYSAFIAARIMALDDSRVTPAHVRNDGQNYHPTHRFVLFGQYETTSTRLGRAIHQGTWVSRLPWPRSWREHFIAEFNGS